MRIEDVPMPPPPKKPEAKPKRVKKPKPKYKKGMQVEVYDVVQTDERAKTRGVVSHVGKEHLSVRLANQRTLMKFRLKDEKVVGFSKPSYTLAVRPDPNPLPKPPKNLAVKRIEWVESGLTRYTLSDKTQLESAKLVGLPPHKVTEVGMVPSALMIHNVRYENKAPLKDYKEWNEKNNEFILAEIKRENEIREAFEKERLAKQEKGKQGLDNQGPASDNVVAVLKPEVKGKKMPKTKEPLQIDKDTAVALFQAIGMNMADEWSLKILNKKVQGIDDMVDDPKQIKKKDLRSLWEECKEAIEKKRPIEIIDEEVEDDEEDDSEEEEEDEDQEDEDEEDSDETEEEEEEEDEDEVDDDEDSDEEDDDEEDSKPTKKGKSNMAKATKKSDSKNAKSKEKTKKGKASKDDDEDDDEDRVPLKKKVDKKTKTKGKTGKNGKKGPPRQRETDKFGSGLGTSAAEINAAMSRKSQTMADLIEVVGCSPVRMQAHLQWLRRNEFAERTDKGWRLTGKTAK